jgi:glycosyltransferase involved in cell wall biosynthesis
MAEPRPHVVHVSTPRTWRGGEQQVLYLVSELSRMGIPQLLVCTRGSRMERVARERGLPHAAFPRLGTVDPFFARALARACARSGANLVHAHDGDAHTAALLARALFRARLPLLVHRRVDFPLRRRRFTRWKWNHPAVRRIVCVSAAIAEILRPDLDAPERLRVVHSGVDPARFPPGPPEGRLRREYAVPAGVRIVGNVAALAGHKDYPTFVETAARVLARGVEARFFAVGEGAERAAIEAHRRRLGLDGKVILTGFRPDAARILPELEVLLFPSSTEGLGTTVLDAFLCRVPVVATRAGGIPELVRDGESGLLAEVGDADGLAERVVRVLSDPALRARLVEGGLRRAAEFGTARTAEQILEIYREVLAEGPVV